MAQTREHLTIFPNGPGLILRYNPSAALREAIRLNNDLMERAMNYCVQQVDLYEVLV